MIKLDQIGRVLTFFAHPDDETLAAGASISKFNRLGVDVHVAIPATGIHSRRNKEEKVSRDLALIRLQEDCRKAMRVLDVVPDQVYFGDFQDNEMDKYSLLETVHWVEEIIQRVNPDILLTHHRYCTNIDHQYCHEAAIVATRPTVKNHIAVLCGEVPSSTGYLRPVQWEPNVYIEVEEKDIESKIQAMKTYEGESRPDPHPRSPEVLRALSKIRGSEAGFFYAEAFMMIRGFG